MFLIERLFSFFFQAEDGIRDLVRSRGLGDVYKRQLLPFPAVIDEGDDTSLNPNYSWSTTIAGSTVSALSLIHI